MGDIQGYFNIWITAEKVIIFYGILDEGHFYKKPRKGKENVRAIT